MNSDINAYCQDRIAEFGDIPSERKIILHKLADAIKLKIVEDLPINIVVICTHNSRRSHFGQIWLDAATSFYGISNCISFSGGTEATAVFPSVVSTLKSIGFNITSESTDENNPRYLVERGEEVNPLILFSKKYNSPPNPESNFIAILVCHEASEACPVVVGADSRIQLTYIDPKISDGTNQQEETYANTCDLIAREMLYAISTLNYE